MNMVQHEFQKHVEHAKILYIDDDNDLIAIYKRFFEDTGYDFRTALSAEEGYDIALGFMPDLIICDVLLPGMNGIDFCRKIKSGAGFSDVIFMLVTGMEVDSNDMVEGFNAGADEYLMKPFSRDEILARVNSLLRIKKLKDELLRANNRIENLTGEMEKMKSGRG
jgi:DNA-binding response OmpR family regulator